jgi:hypothetical protein
MAGITYEIAAGRLQAYLDAEDKILLGQTVEMDGRRLTRANLEMVQRGIVLWDTRCRALDPSAGGGAMRVREVIPR